MKTLAEKIEVMQAALDGKKIEIKHDDTKWQSFLYSDTRPTDNEFIGWNWSENDYRIKPEPMEFWMIVKNGVIVATGNTKETAEQGFGLTVEAVKFREVTE